MKAIRRWTGTVLGVLLGGSVAVGQSSSVLTGSPGAGSPPVVTITTEPLPGAVGGGWNGNSPGTPGGTPSLLGGTPGLASGFAQEHVVNGPSPGLATPGPVESWLNYNQPGCCGPVGGHGPISYDLYLRMGASLPVGGGQLSQSLNTGWSTRGGVRTLFFQPQGESANYIDMNLEHIYNSGQSGKTLAFFGRPVTVGSLNRWNVGLALGKEWYTGGPGYLTGSCGDWKMSYGFDVGGRWGTSSVDYNRTPPPNPGLLTGQHYDVTGGIYGGANLNWEKSMGGWSLILGGRLETAATFTDVLQGYGGTLYEVKLLLNAGIRY